MKEKDLKDILKSKFQLIDSKYFPDQWKTVLSLLFKKIDYFNSTESLFTDHEKVINGKQIGTVKLDDGKQLAIFTIEVADNINIIRNRQGLREIAADHIDQNIIHGALAFFYNKNQADYRFSFIAKEAVLNLETGELIKGETKPKRYTYLLGANEACTTPAKRMMVLADKKEKGEVTLKELKEVFSVETLNKDFFKTYKAHYEKFVNHLAEESNPFRVKLIDSDKETKDQQEKPIRDFVKKLLGRIVFLQFLEKKGWMGCNANTQDWTGGNPRFMYQLFEDYSKPENFHSQCLTKLFFETLNIKRPIDKFELKGLNGKMNGSRVPYLNGGLFEPEKNKSTLEIDFPADFFKELLEFFDQYNFTIDENSPDDHEVGIDPEMLGHIFENLLEENRGKGTYYTPKEIVHYMCQESLMQYLRTHLPECTEDESPATKELKNFIRNGIVGERNDKKNFVVQQAKRIEKLLDKVKICDPAIGSGAFPIGMLHEIFKAKTNLDLTLDHAEVKKQIIQNCIYGVDIENGAVEIARLRFWLALVVDEDVPQPLPNLDYKIMQGNSLLESFDAINLKFERKKLEVKVEKQKNLFGEVNEPQMSLMDYLRVKQDSKEFDIVELEEKFFNSKDADEKEVIRNKIDKIEKDFISEQLEKKENELKDLIRAKDYDYLLDIDQARTEAMVLKLANGKKVKELKKLKSELQKIEESKQKLFRLKRNEKPYFLWSLYFMDVFEKGGFDIVIGNPPYLRIQGIRKDDSRMADELSKKFKAAIGSFDLYVLFVEQAFKLIKPNAVVNFIMPVKWTNAAFGAGLRKIVTKDGFASKIISFGAYQVFNVSTYTGIQWFKKNQKELLFKELDKDVTTNDELGHFLKGIDNSNFSRINTSSLNEASWILTDSIKAGLLKKINVQKNTLKDVFEKIFVGLQTSLDKVYVLKIIEERSKTYYCYSNSLNREIEIEKGLVKPFLMGKDVKRYDIPEVKHVVIFPYDISDKQHPVLMSLDFIKNNFSLGYMYLIENRAELEERENDRMRNDRFYAYIYPKNLTDFANKKILTAEIANKGEMTIDENGFYYHTTKVYSLALKPNLEENITYFLGVLNSKLLFFFLSATGYVLRGGYFTFKTDYLNPFPIKRIDFNQKKDVYYHDQIIKLVSKVIRLKKEKNNTNLFENKIDALVFHLYSLTEQEMLQMLDAFKDLSIKDRNQIQNEYWNIANNKFQLEK